MIEDLSKYSAKDLVTKFGVYMPVSNVVGCIQETDETEEEIRKILLNINNLTAEELQDFIVKNGRYLNKPNFLFNNLLYLTGVRKVRGLNPNLVSDLGLKIKMVKNYLIKRPTIILDHEDSLICELYDSRDYTTEKQKQSHTIEKEKALKRIKEIDKSMGIKYILALHVLSDIARCYCKDVTLGFAIRENIIINTYKNNGLADREIVDRILNDRHEGISFEDFLTPFKQELKDKAEYIDWDKFLLLSAYRAKCMLNETLIKDENKDRIETLAEIMKTAKKLIQNRNSKINTEIEFADGTVKKVRYSYKQLENDMSTYMIDSTYYGEDQLADTREELMSGRISISDIYNKKILRLLNLSKEDKVRLMDNNDSNIIDLYVNGLITDRDLETELEKKPEIKAQLIKELINFANKPRFLTNNYIIQLYFKEKMQLAEIAKLHDIIGNEVTEKKLIELYRKSSSEDMIEQVEKYYALFREIKIKMATAEEKEELSNNIILELGNDMKEEDFIELYRKNLITITSVAEWNGEQFVTRMLLNGLLKPADVKQLLVNRKIDIEEIKRDFLTQNLTDEEKISFIVTTFDGKEYEDIREELYQTLNFSEDYKKRQNSRKGGLARTKNKTDEKDIDDYAIDPALKMKLLLLVDKDYTYSMTKDGHIILQLPNYNKVLIEKMFRKTRKGLKFATATATYIMDIDKFNSSNIISDDKKIDRSELNEMRKLEKANRYYHSKNWGDTIREVFDINKSGRHSIEEQKEIEQVIEDIKKDRENREI